MKKNLWESMKDNLGKCYELSWQYITREGFYLENGDMQLIHGYITDIRTGRCIDHAWIEYGSSVYDTVMEKEFPKRVYYAMYKAEVGKSYSYTEASDKGVEFGTYGPWHKIPAGKVKWWKEDRMKKENIIEIKEEVQVGDFILEEGDKIQILETYDQTNPLKIKG